MLTGRHGLEQDEAEKFVALMFDTIRDGVERDGMVKVRGFGTFKIIGVEARESVNVNTGERVTIESHGKVTFTPDATMKELVNKPFSQFETVILNEGIEFDDIEDKREDETAEPDPDGAMVSEEATEEVAEAEESAVDEEPAEEPVVADERTAEEDVPVAEEETAEEELPRIEDSAEDVPEPEAIPEPEPETAEEAEIEEPVADYGETEIEEPVAVPEETEDEEPPVRDVTEKPGGVWKWCLFCLVSLLLMAISAYSGYRYGLYAATEKDAVVADSVVKPKRKQVVIHRVVRQKKEAARRDTAEVTPRKDSTTVEKRTAEKEEFDSSKYERMDNRVRTGAYRIVGTEKTVTVRAGETLEDISRKILGEGMACYIEVYNGFDRDVKLKEGQKILIPKLELKKRARK